MYFESYEIQILVSWNENRTLIRFHLAGIFNLRPLTIGLDILHTINSFRTSSSISLQLTWLCGDDADLTQLEGDVEAVVPHHQVVVKLAPCGGRIEFKNWFYGHDSACWSIHLSWPSWRRPSKENSSNCGENLCWMSWLDLRTTVLISGRQRKLWQLNISELYQKNFGWTFFWVNIFGVKILWVKIRFGWNFVR